jgi:hypothetical protein
VYLLRTSAKFKKRPAVVLFAKPPDYLVTFVTSKVGKAGQYDLLLQPTDQNGLIVRSAALTDKLFTIHTSLVDRRLGALGLDEFRILIARLCRLLRGAAYAKACDAPT